MESGMEAIQGFAAAGREMNPEFYKNIFYNVDKFKYNIF